MPFPVTLTLTGTGQGPWKIINAPMWGPTEISFNVTVTGTVNWSILLTNTNLLKNDWSISGPSGPTLVTANTYAAPAALTSQTGNSAGSVNDPFFAWAAIINSGTGSITVEAVEAGMH